MPDANLVYCIGVSGLFKGFSPLFVGIPRLWKYTTTNSFHAIAILQFVFIF